MSSAERLNATASLVDALHGFAKTAVAFGDEHPTSRLGAERVLEALARSGLPVTLQFVEGCAFRDKSLVPVGEGTLRKASELAVWLRRCEADELTFDIGCGAVGLLRLARAFSTAARGIRDSLSEERVEGIRFRAIPHAMRGEETEEVAADVFAAAQLGLALEALRGLVRAEVWPFRAALHVVRRLDRAVERHPRAVLRVLELSDIGSVSRRVAGGATLVQMCLSASGVAGPPKRALTHLALMLGAQGVRARGALAFQEAVESANHATAAACSKEAGPLDPHRGQVLSALAALAAGRAVPGEALLRLAYRLEAERSPEGVSFDLTTLDLFAEGLRAGLPSDQSTWLTVAIHAFGVIPPGAKVRLADGRTGVVLDPGKPGDPLRPTVLVDGARVEPDEPVTLESTS